MKLTPCKLKEIVHEEARNLHEIGWDNLPDGWDEDSLDSFARSLTDKTQDDSEGFFTACMDEVEDKFDDPEAFCASLKDEYLGTTDWRGESTNKQTTNMKLTESKLRKIIREEMEALGGEKYLQEFQQYLSSVGRQRNPYEFEYRGYIIGLDPMDFALHVSVRQEGAAPSYEPSVSATIEDGGVEYMIRGDAPTGRPQMQSGMYRSPDQVINKMIKTAK